MKIGKRTTTVAISLAAVALLLAIAASPAVRVRYHLWQLEATHQAIWSQPNEVYPDGLASFGNETLFDRFDYHRDCLHDLGYLFHKKYRFHHAVAVEGGNGALYRLISGMCNDLHALPYCEGVSTVDVWDVAENEPLWDAFYPTHNTPDFATEQAELIDQVLAERRR